MFGVQKLKFQAILEKIFVIDDKTHLHVVCVCVCACALNCLGFLLILYFEKLFGIGKNSKETLFTL